MPNTMPLVILARPAKFSGIGWPAWSALAYVSLFECCLVVLCVGGAKQFAR